MRFKNLYMRFKNSKHKTFAHDNKYVVQTYYQFIHFIWQRPNLHFQSADPESIHFCHLLLNLVWELCEIINS